MGEAMEWEVKKSKFGFIFYIFGITWFFIAFVLLL